MTSHFSAMFPQLSAGGGGRGAVVVSLTQMLASPWLPFSGDKGRGLN